MKTSTTCSSCGKSPITKDEIGICKKLLGTNTKKLYCLECFSAYLDTTVDELLEKIEEFKDEGCTLFK